MLLTLYYMYATLLQCWRLALTKAKISAVLSERSSVVLYHKNRATDKTRNNIEHLLYYTEEKVACTVVPIKVVSLSTWLPFSSCTFFPFSKNTICLSGVPIITLLIQADMRNCNNTSDCNQLQVTELGVPVAWTATDNFKIIMKTDLDKFTKLVSCFLANPIAINDGMEVLRVEMINLEGEPKMSDSDKIFKKYKWPKIISNQRQWRHLVEDLKSICKKVNHTPHTQNGNVCNEIIHTTKTQTENVTSISKTHLSVSKRDLHSDNKPRIKIDKPDDKHKTDKKSHRKIDKVRIADKTVVADKNKSDNNTKEIVKSEIDKKTVNENIKSVDSATKVHPTAGEAENIEKKVLLPKEKPAQTPKLNKKKYTPSIDEKLENLNDSLNKMAETRNKLDELKNKHAKQLTPVKQSSSSLDDSKQDISNENSETEIEIKDKTEKVKHKRQKPSNDRPQTSTSIEDERLEQTKQDKKLDIKEKIKHKRKEKQQEKELSSSPEDEPVNDTELNTEDKEKTEKFKHKRPKELTQEKMKQSSSLDRIKSKDGEKHKYDTRSKREKYAKRHSDDKLLNKNGEIEKNISKEKDLFASKKRFTKAKPPNVLVFADSHETVENTRNVLRQVLNGNKYVIYEMSPSRHSHLADNCTLAVICGNVPPNLTAQLLRFLLTGGQMLCLCSDLLNSVLHTFATAEVREHELVRFSYGEWRRVRMMHHIFCYQASPVRKHFSQDSDAGSSSNHSPVAPRTPSTVELHHDGITYTVYVQVLGTEETWHTPSILLAKIKNGMGKAVFSQVHLEIDPSNFEDNETVCTTLKDSDKSRIEILKDILSNHLGMDCNRDDNAVIEYSPAFFLGRNDLKQSLLSDLMGANMLRLPKMTLQFCGKGEPPPIASERLLPVLVHSCPTTFSTVNYFETLKTESLGRLLIYADVIPSSMDAITGAKLKHGFTVIPRHQTSGVGRGGNIWLSPPGSAMYSMQIHIPTTCELAGRLSLVQHLVAVAAVSSIKSIPGYDKLNIGLKWPNDIYAYSGVKIGGIIVNSMVDSNAAICNIGLGINLNNAQPTTCIKSIIEKYNEENATNLNPISLEQYLAFTFNELERILHMVQDGKVNYLFELYYKYWLHSNSIVTVQTGENVIKDVAIVGIDDYGFLMVRAKDGSTSSVQPDDNTFDMMQGLIAPKIR